MTSQSYFLDISSEYRNLDKYPNATDFAVTFKTFSETGYFINGAPLSPDSFFQKCSIDPDYNNQDLQIENALLDNIKLQGNTIYLAGHTTSNNQTVRVKYQGTNLSSFTIPNSAGAFIVSVNQGFSPVVNWAVYAQSTTGATWGGPNKASFQIDISEKIYFMFDFGATNMSLFKQTSTQTVTLLQMVNPTINSLTDTNVVQGIVYLDSLGNLADVNGHNWGYHILSANCDLKQTEVQNGSFGFEIDESSNIVAYSNLNPLEPRAQNINWLAPSTPNYYSTQDYNNTLYRTSTGATYIIARGTPTVVSFLQFFNVTTGLVDLGISTLPVVNTGGTRAFVSSANFVNYNNTLFSISGMSSVGTTYNTTVLVPFKIFRINVGTLSYTEVFSSSFLDYNTSPAAILVGDTIYIGVVNRAALTLEVYAFNITMNTVTLASTAPVSSFVYQFHYYVKAIRKGSNITFVVMQHARTTMISVSFFLSQTDADQIATHDVYSFQFATNTLVRTATFSEIANGFQFISDDLPDSRVILYIFNSTYPQAYLWDITNPSLPKRVYVINEIRPTSGVTFIQELSNGQKHYWLYVASNMVCMDNPDQPILLDATYVMSFPGSPFFPYIFCPSYIDKVTNRVFLNAMNANPAATRRVGLHIFPLFTESKTIKSQHFSQNTSLTYTPTTLNATALKTFNVSERAYVITGNSSSIIIIDITTLQTTTQVYSLPVLLPRAPYQFEVWQADGLIYFFVVYNNIIDIYTSPVWQQDSTPSFSLTLLQTLTAGTTINKVKPLYYKNFTWLYFYTFNTTFFKYRLQSGLFVFRNSAVVSAGRQGLSFDTYDYPNQFNVLFAYSTSATTAVPLSPTAIVGYQRWNLCNIDDDFITPTLALNGLPSNIEYQAGNIQPFGPGLVLGVWYHPYEFWNTNVPNHFTLSTPRNFNLQTFNPRGYYGYYNFCSTQFVSQDVYYNITNYMNTVNDATDRLLCMTLPADRSAFIGVFNQVEVPGHCVQIDLSQNNNKNILTIMLDNGKIFFYDVTNPVYAANQTLSVQESSWTVPYNFGSSFVHRISNVGEPEWLNWFGQDGLSTSFGQIINIANLSLTPEGRAAVVGGWEQKLQVYEYGYTGAPSLVNNLLINEIDPVYNGFSALIEPDGTMVNISGYIGSFGTYIQKTQYLESKQQFFNLLYTENAQTNILPPQPRGTLTTPTDIQRVLFGADTTTSFVVANDKDNLSLFDVRVYTTENQSSVKMIDLALSDTQFSMIGVSNALIIKGTDSSGNEVQRLYNSVSRTPINLFPLGLIYSFDITGNYISSQYFTSDAFQTIYIADIKLYPDSNSLWIVPGFSSNSNSTQTDSYYNKDSSLATTFSYTGASVNTAIVKYDIVSTDTDLLGSTFSRLVLKDPPTYPFDDGLYINYNLFVKGYDQDPYLNQNFLVRDNFFDGSKYVFNFNSSIDVSKLDRRFNQINNQTGNFRYYYCNLANAPLASVLEYNVSQMPSVDNTIIATFDPPLTNYSSQYYVSFPQVTNQGTITKVLPFQFIGTTGASFILALDDVNDLRSPAQTGPFYGPYLDVNEENKSIFYKLNFFPGSIKTSVVYFMRIISLTIPNRPLRNLFSRFGPDASFNDIPYIYVSIYNVDDDDNYDTELVNLVYDNNPLTVKPYPLFQISTFETSPSGNFVTFSSDSIPKIKFLPQYFNLRIRLFDPYGNVIIFDQASTKLNDQKYAGGRIPSSLFDVYLRLELSKV